MQAKNPIMLYTHATSMPFLSLVGPLILVISVSLLVEGFSDYKRHLSDHATNNADCVILRRTDELLAEGDAKRDESICKGKDVIVDMKKAYFFDSTLNKSASIPTRADQGTDANQSNLVRVAYQKIRRMDIRQGHFVLVKNREMVPADLVLLASSNDQGGAYIETSSIDGETNLKLRLSPHVPRTVIQGLLDGNPSLASIAEEIEKEQNKSPGSEDVNEKQLETIDFATKRLAISSYLGRPNAPSVMMHPSLHDGKLPQANTGNGINLDDGALASSEVEDWGHSTKLKLGQKLKDGVHHIRQASGGGNIATQHDVSAAMTTTNYVATLTTEPPNASVHTFSGKLTFPPFGGMTPCFDIPLGADNVLLRGAVIRNTEWVIGLAFFTGTDTKLVQNSFDTPSKFSQLDQLINKTVVMILIVLILCVFYLATKAVSTNSEAFELLYYAGFNKNVTEPWPYLPNFDPPEWSTETTYWYQYSLLYLTLLNNFIPLSLYISVEMIQFFMLWLVYVDLELYDDTTNTRGLARTTIISDLGRIQYIFSDKTGTLTQNVMRFKRCSVDGMIFGAPIQRTRPGADIDAEMNSRFHPLRQLLVGRFRNISSGLEGLASPTDRNDDKLTFNSEMFLRVMSLCHTVVVEKDIDKQEFIGSDLSMSSNVAKQSIGSYAKSLFVGRNRSNSGDSSLVSPLGSVTEGNRFDSAVSPSPIERGRDRLNTAYSFAPGEDPKAAKNSDGAPFGYAYQAESPDEGALVSAASELYGFQVIARDSSGIRLQCSFPSHLQDSSLTQRLKSKKVTPEQIAAETAHVAPADVEDHVGGERFGRSVDMSSKREEVWTILAVNKFDSDRKRMSVLLRSPAELGGLPILFCKGADSSMLSLEVCGRSIIGDTTSATNMSTVNENEETVDGVNEEEWEMAHMLGMQVHLGEFAKEGLRTLVLGMRVLTEGECSEWLEVYKSAATSIRNREDLLTAAATQIERDLHIVGATAIEDKLQKNVPETIATLAKAGIKLWVLTGDKRETAVEIGYSTAVLTSKMHLTEVPDNGITHVRTQMAMEFVRLIKIGRLQEYQRSALERDSGTKSLYKKIFQFLAAMSFSIGKFRRSCNRSFLLLLVSMMKLIGRNEAAEETSERVAELSAAEKNIVKTIEKRRNARLKADETIKAWLESSDGVKHLRNKAVNDDVDVALASDETPAVFVRAKSAHNVLQDIASSGELTQPELRQLSLAHLTAHQANISGKDNDPIVDEDTLSLESFVPGGLGDKADFDTRKRTLLERMFAVDREVRKGRLKKHMTRERLAAISEKRASVQENIQENKANSRIASRALVIEGAALKHLLGNPEYEEILFAVASSCDAVIACRVSPRQKALLVNLVRQKVTPEPITLAIGDGANDVGMIQEAHVGIGISGKEGQQAVNASDFAIAQFRFLETLVLIHGRWNFFRLSTVVLFSFYKNAVMAGIIIIYTSQTLYSGTPLFDEWVIAMLNFVAAWPIIFVGFFDRCLSKDYVRNNPEVYQATRDNQLITVRSLVRWIIVCFIHVFTLYYFTVPQQSYGGGMTSAFLGLMRNEDQDAPGNGEGGDLKSVGTVTFTCMIFLLSYKVFFVRFFFVRPLSCAHYSCLRLYRFFMKQDL
jgi:magnesium-transporting ATPase (P-type)